MPGSVVPGSVVPGSVVPGSPFGAPERSNSKLARLQPPLPRTVGSWLTYGLCLAVFVVGVIDQAFGGLGLFVIVGLLLLGLTFLAQLVKLPSRWRDPWWRRFLPLLACLVVLPGMRSCGYYALIARFYWHRAQYEAVATAVKSGAHPEVIRDDERALGHWVEAMRVQDLDDLPPTRRIYSAPTDPPPRSDYLRIVGVHFLVVTHGNVGHVGFMRTFDPEAARLLDKGRGADGWAASKNLTDNWYLVAD